MVNRFIVGLIIAGAVVVGVGAGAWRALKDREASNAATQRQKKADIEVTIVEGKRREEIAAQLATAGVTSYEEFMKATIGYEGTLFPDTYRFFPNTEAREVVSKLKTNYASRLAGLSVPTDRLILASIIEREAQSDEERAVIAGVYQNRLNNNMLLQADPTVQYGKDNNNYAVAADPKTFVFWGEITQADYSKVISVFNTYLNPGLPPAPLCNPGKKSIEAALAPAQHDYLYFLHKDGQLLLSKTLAEHQRKQR